MALHPDRTTHCPRRQLPQCSIWLLACCCSSLACSTFLLCSASDQWCLPPLATMHPLCPGGYVDFLHGHPKGLRQRDQEAAAERRPSLPSEVPLVHVRGSGRGSLSESIFSLPKTNVAIWQTQISRVLRGQSRGFVELACSSSFSLVGFVIAQNSTTKNILGSSCRSLVRTEFVIFTPQVQWPGTP